MTYFKEGPRIKASREQWKKLQAEKTGACRVCGASAYTGYTSLHHLVPRSQGGDDIADNLAPLCGSGTTGCHGKIEARDKYAGRRLRANLTADEYEYVVRKKGWDWLEQRYPFVPTYKAGLTEGESGALGVDGSLPSDGPFDSASQPPSVSPGLPISAEARTSSSSSTAWPPNPFRSRPIPGHDCPTCSRRIPYPKTEKTPTNRPFSFRIPEEHRDSFREVLEAASRHIGIHEKPFWQWNTVNAGLVLLLQGEKDLLR